MIKKQRKFIRALITAGAISLSLVGSLVHAAGGKVSDPNGTAPDRYVYYPGTEVLGKDKIRLFACGTGMPSARRDMIKAF